MFDIGFWELLVIAVVALLVVGPEELPTLARTAGRWVGKARRFMTDMKDELETEVDRANELKQRITEETKIAEAHRALNETTNTVSMLKKDAREVVTDELLKPISKEERDRVAGESQPLPQAEQQALSEGEAETKSPTHGKTP